MSKIINNIDEQINIINCNMKDYISNDTFETFDLVTCNPPYFNVMMRPTPAASSTLRGWVGMLVTRSVPPS